MPARIITDPAVCGGSPVKGLKIAGGVCCFCSEDVDEVGIDPCTLSISTNGDGAQSWPCHAACYRERLGDLPYARDLFEDTDN